MKLTKLIVENKKSSIVMMIKLFEVFKKAYNSYKNYLCIQKINPNNSNDLFKIK